MEDTYAGHKNDPLSLNLYTYCHNNPIMYTDPSGHRIETEGSTSGKKKDSKDTKSNNSSNKTNSSKNNQSSSGSNKNNSGSGTKAEKPSPTPKPTSTPTATPKKSTYNVDKKENNTANTGTTGNQGYEYSQANTGSIALPGVGFAGTVAVESSSMSAFGFIISKICIPFMIIVTCDQLTAVHTDPGEIEDTGKTDIIPSVINGTTSSDIVNEISSVKEEKESTTIYRWGSGSNTNLTPRQKDITGLSFSTVKPIMGNYVTTTIEEVNATGELIAIQDAPTHVSVMPTDFSSIPEWIDSRKHAETNPHRYTQILKVIVK